MLLLGFIGFTSACNNGGQEYGTPMADFIVKGTVKSSATQQALPDIKVQLGEMVVNTDGSGKYELQFRAFAASKAYSLKFSDNDTVANGNMAPVDTTVIFSGTFTGGDGWYKGKEEITFDIDLDPKP
jgi:putative lipoprotein (rSAM/lipoprotein system)